MPYASNVAQLARIPRASDSALQSEHYSSEPHVLTGLQIYISDVIVFVILDVFRISIIRRPDFVFLHLSRKKPLKYASKTFLWVGNGLKYLTLCKFRLPLIFASRGVKIIWSEKGHKNRGAKIGLSEI